MTIDEIPKLSLAILKRNIPGYSDLSDAEILKYFDCVYDINNAPVLTDEDKAEELLKETIQHNRSILAICDYDSDGLACAAIAYKALKRKSNNFRVIHNKRIHGNGFNPVLVAKIKRIHDRKPIDLIITGDHGSSSEDAFKELKEYGIKKILLTDHHEIPANNYPVSADVFINPQKVPGDPIGMCGAHVLFKILSCLYKDDKDIQETLYKECLPHVAIATVTDVMSLDIDYNRLVVRAGLQYMNRDTGLWAMLKQKLNIPITYSYRDLGFVLGPFINTGNRVSAEELFYRILVEPDMDRLSTLIDEGVKLNISRKDVKKTVLSNLLSTIDAKHIKFSLSIIVDTPIAINGIIASSLGEQFQVPTTCFIVDTETNTLSGSARGILDHISITELYTAMAKEDPELFITQGGHKGAGGCRIPFDKFERFKELFEVMASKVTVPTDAVIIDNTIAINTKYLDYGIIEEVNYVGPYGKDWAAPIFNGAFKIKAIFAMKSLAILTLMTLSGREIKGTYFFKPDDSQDSVEYDLQRGVVIHLSFEPQYYKRRNRVSYTLMIHSYITKK